MKIRHQIERFFEVWSEVVVHYRWAVLIITLLVTALIAPQIRHGWLDVSLESYLPHDDPAIETYNDFRHEFNFMPRNAIVIVLQDEIFTLKNLARLKAFHERLENELPYAQELTSLVNVRYSRGEGDTLLIDDLSEVWPESEAEMPAFRELVMSNPNYVGGLVSKDARMVIISVMPNIYTSVAGPGDSLDALTAGFEDSDVDALLGSGADESPANRKPPDFLHPDEEAEFAKAVYRIIDEVSGADFKIYTVGGATMNQKLSEDFETSTERAVILGITIIVILLALLFRRASGVLMPLLVVLLSLVTTLALWPALGFAFNGNTQIIPTFILAVGIADAVHILSLFYRYYDHGASKHDAIIRAMRETSVAVLMTTVTTAAGLLSFLSSDMTPTRTIGIFGSIGVGIAFIYTLALLPSLLAIIPIRRRQENGREKTGLVLTKIDALIEWCGDLGVTHARSVLICAGLLSAIAVVGISQVRFEHDPVRWYDKDSDYRRGVEMMDERLNGSLVAELLIKFGAEDSLKRVDVLNAIDEIEQVVLDHHDQNTQVRDVKSILSVVKETHQSLNRNDPDFYGVPESRQAIAQELLLFENSGSDDILDFTNTDFSTARIDFTVPSGDVLHYPSFLQSMRDKVSAVLDKHGIHGAEVTTTGLMAIFGSIVYTLLYGTVSSYILAILFVAILMILLMGNVRRGLLALSPNITPILLTLGVMGLFGIDLNTHTSLLGCIVIGVSVDDTIHFMHHFRRFAATTDDVREVVHKTLHTCGRAITFTSIVLIGGFISHMTGIMTLNREFGALTSLAIAIALFANLILAPALMTVFWHPDRKSRERVLPSVESQA